VLVSHDSGFSADASLHRGQPRLLESRARTIEQMRLIKALCRFVELAEPPRRG